MFYTNMDFLPGIEGQGFVDDKSHLYRYRLIQYEQSNLLGLYPEDCALKSRKWG